MKVFIAGIFIFLYVLPASAQFSYNDVEVLYDSAWTYKNLQLIPIRFKAGRGRNTIGPMVSLSEAVGRKKASIKEIGGNTQPDKGYVSITNKLKENILVHSGELIKGGKQDRAMAATRIIPGKSKKEILDVYCIEKMRWQNNPKKFYHSGSGDIELRKVMDTKKSQIGVWKEIDRQFQENAQESETWSYLELPVDSTRNNADYTAYFKQKMAESGAGSAGILFITGNKIISVELFASADITRAIFDSMLATYIRSMKKNTDPPVVSRGRQKTFLDNVLTTRETQVKLISQQGNAYKHLGKTIHIIVYGSGF
jgi:hypothetical protein